MKKTLSALFGLVLLVSTLLGVMVVPASAANTATLTLTDTAGELGDTVEVSISVSANSYIVNGDFDVIYDPAVLRYVPDSCKATSLMGNVYWAANSPIDGEVLMSFATDASVGITDKGALFTMQFEIISKDTVQTSLDLVVRTLRGCNGGEDYDVKATVVGGQIGIVGGADPWNFLQEAFLESGHENVRIDANGVWTVTGDFTLSPDFTMNYSEWQYIVQKFTTNTPVKITLVDNDPLGVYGKHEIGLYDNFVGPQYYPAKSYDQVNSILGIYNWNISHAGWKNVGLATIDQVIVHFESSNNVSAVFTSLYMSQTPGTTVSAVRTTATKSTVSTSSTSTSTTTTTTTTTTKSYPDVKQGTWYYESVSYVSASGYMSGYQNGRFGPSDNLQRQDFVVILARISGADLTVYKNRNGGLSDVKVGSYYAPAVAWAVDNGIITGYQNGTFGVGDTITREQVCTIFYRFKNKPAVENANTILGDFPDHKRISSFATDAMAWAVKNGVVSGMQSGEISPVTGASRAQIATILMRMDQNDLL